MIRFIPLFLFVSLFSLAVERAHSVTPTHELLHGFSQGPSGPTDGVLARDSNGYFWGVTVDGGVHGVGTIYKVKADGSDWRIVHSFGVGGTPNPNYSRPSPTGGLVYDGEGYVWGTVGSGDDFGRVFKVNTSSGELSTVVEFTGNAGEYKGRWPDAALIDDGAGNLWGTTSAGGAADCGTIFKVQRSTGAFVSVAEFVEPGTGVRPNTSLVRDGAGYFWGTTWAGGAPGSGTVFKLNPNSGVITTVIEFTGNVGAKRGSLPSSALLPDRAGNLWGATEDGGAFGWGTIYKVNVDTGGMTVVVDFTRDGSVNRGGRPAGSLASDGAGNIWGTTMYGGIDDGGTAFKINAATGVLTTVHQFSSESDPGLNPRSGLVADGGEYFWGTTTYGPFTRGCVYKLKKSSGEIAGVLDFDAGGPDYGGMGPSAGFARDSRGDLWSTTSAGGRFGFGTVFKWSPRTGERTTVVEFSGKSGLRKGGVPTELVADDSGYIWGTTKQGGTLDLGTVFKINSDTGEFVPVAEFGGSNKGSWPVGRLARDGMGFLWGTTTGNDTGYETIFKVSEATGSLTTVAEFLKINGAFKGSGPSGELVNDGAGFFWGTTSWGGSTEFGTIFKVNILTGELTTVKEFASQDDGANPSGLVADGAGSFLGVTEHGGTMGAGTIFKFDPSNGQLTKLFDFEFWNGRGFAPRATLAGDGRGSFWGITTAGGAWEHGINGWGTVFKFNPITKQLVTMVDFTGSGDQAQGGGVPYGALVVHPDGDLYGTTMTGGPGGGGTIFRIRGAVPRQLAQRISHRAGSHGSGSAVPAEPEGTTFVSAGEPAVDHDSAAFLATIRDSGGKQMSAIFGGEAIVARAGQTAPGAEPANFKSFDEPLVSFAGVAFGAKLSDGRSGVWTTAFTGDLQLVELTKSAAPGLADSKIASIMSYSLRGEEIVALLKLQGGAGGVTAANDITLTRYVNGNESRLLSKGQGIPVGDAIPQPLLSLSAFTPSPLAPGQDRSHAEGVVGAKGTVRLSDRTLREVVLRARGDGVIEVVEISNLAVKNSPEFLAKSFGLPAVGGAEGLAYLATAHARAASRDQVIATDLLEDESDDVPLEITEGDQQAPGAEPATFLAMSDPVVNDQQRVAFLASLQGQGVTSKNNRGLWWGDATGGMSLVARLGDFAPDRDGAPSAATFAKIERFGLPDGWDAGPLFIATLTGPRGSNVTRANNRALYGCDSDGKLRELLRTGDELEHAGEMKKVRSFTALSGGKPIGGRRAFTTAGHVAARAVFTDNSTGIIQITVP